MTAYKGPTASSLAPDGAQVSRHLEFWFGESLNGEIDIGWFDPASGQLNRFRRFDVGDLDECIAFIVETNSVAGQSIYFRPALVQSAAPHFVRDEHFLAAPGPWCDLDDQGAADNARTVYTLCRPNLVVVTGRTPHKRAQLFWRREDTLADSAVVRDLNRRIAMRLNGDAKVANPTSLMRIAGTIAWPWKPGRVPERTELVLFDDGRPRSYPAGAIERAFPPAEPELRPLDAQPRPNAPGPSAAPRPLNIGLDGVSADMCIAAIKTGDHWHNNTVRLVGHWIARGWSDAEILNAAEPLTLPGYTVAQTRREVERMIAGARRKWGVSNADHELSESTTSARPGPIDPRDWEGMPVPTRAWLVEDWIPMRHVTALYGDGGLGKTLLAQMLLTSVATGRSWLGLAVPRFKAFGLLCEDHPEDLHITQARINAWHGLRFTELGDLRLWSSVGLDNLLMLFDGRDGTVGRLTEFFGDLLNQVCAFGARFVVLDTAADLFGGNENNRGQVRQFVSNACGRIARAIDGAVLLCAHPSLSGLSSGNGTGGSTAWSNTVRSRLYLSAAAAEHDGEDPDPDLRTLARKKANYARSGEGLRLRWTDGVFVVESAPAAGDDEAVISAVIAEIARAWDEGMPYSDVPQAKNRFVLNALPRRIGRTRSEVERAYTKLFVAGRLKVGWRNRHGNLRGLQVVETGPREGGA